MKPKIRLVISVSIILVFIVCLVVLNRRNESTTAKAFLSDLLSANTVSNSYLSEELNEIVQNQCVDSTIIGCSAKLISPSWDEFTDVHFVIGSGSDNSILFHTIWSDIDDPISVVVVMTIENDKWVVEGWRGFTVWESENEDARLLRGLRRDNEFPPPKE